MSTKWIKEDVADEIEPASSLTLSIDERTPMTKPVIYLPRWRSSYNVDIRNGAKEHEFSSELDLSGRKEFNLSDPPYTLQKDGRDDHAK